MFRVGAEILVVPDGLSDDGELAHIALQITPSREPRVWDQLELATWPSQIAERARHMELLVRGTTRIGSVQQLARIDCTSALNAYHFTEHADGTYTRNACLAMADQLWAKVFAVDPTLGFRPLFNALRAMHDDGTSLRSAKVLPSYTADLQLFWKLQREGNHDPSTRQTVTDRWTLWRKIESYMKRGPNEEQRRHLEHRLASAGPEDESTRQLALRESLRALLFPTDTESAALAEAEAHAAEMFHGYFRGLQRARRDGEAAAAAGTELKDEPAEDNWGVNPVDVAGRKLSTLLSLPSLATYLGLGVEIAVDCRRLLEFTDQFEDDLALAVRFTTRDGDPLHPGEPLAWTAFTLATGTDTACFMPRAQGSGARPKAIPLERGLVKAGSTIGEREVPRFRLAADDAENMTMDRRQAVLYADQATFNDVDKVMRIVGLVVYDTLAAAALEEELAQDSARLVEGADTLNWAEDLLRGLRPDFALSRARVEERLSPDKLVWRSISGREIHCEDEEFDPNFRSLEPIRRMLHRDHGLTQVPVEEIPPASDSDAPLQVQKIDQMFVWQGENIGIARNLEEPDDNIELQALSPTDMPPREGILSDPATDLGLRIRQSFPMAPELKMMPLREGRPYAVAMRAVFANGVSLPLHKAVARYSSTDEFNQLVLGGEEDGKANGKAVLLPPEDAGPPGVHLHWRDALVSANNLRDEAPGENLITVVLRDGRGPANGLKAGRFITPPRVPFDLAEKQGQFDKIAERVPSGAFTGRSGLWRFGPDGAFPEARFGRDGGGVRYLMDGELLQFVSSLGYSTGHLTIHLGDDKTLGPNNQSRGTVAILGPQDDYQPGSFFPHKHARQLEAQLECLTYRDEWGQETRGHAVTRTAAYRDFWKANGNPGDAKPLFLELVPAENTASFSNAKEQDIYSTFGTRVRLPTLKVQLGEGEVWQLSLNAYDRVGTEDRHGKKAVVRLVHAVQKPLSDTVIDGQIDNISTPEGGADSAKSLRLGLNAVTVSVSEAGDENRVADAQPTWEKHVRNYVQSGKDMLDWDSQEGGDTTFIVGRLGLDRKSTGDLRVEAEWENFDGETVTLQNGKWISNPSRLRATLMAIDIERNGHPRGIDLLQKGQFFDGDVSLEKLRGQSYAVPKDGQLAREYCVRLVTGTSFKDYYAGGNTKTRTTDAFLLKKKCTFRPPPPRLAEIETRLVWSGIAESQTRGRRRSSQLRIRLDEKWFVSGKGEKLGIVLRRSDSSIDESSRFAPYLSVAGADPTMLTARVPEYLNAENFVAVGDQKWRVFEKIDLFLPEQPEGTRMRSLRLLSTMVEGQDKLSVDILALTPQFNETEGLYCDFEVRLDPNQKFNPYNAFVHLGLVRFQDNAVKDLRASFPLKDPKTKVYLLPDRELRVTKNRRGKSRSLKLTGSGYKLAPLADYGRQLPVLHATLMEWDERTGRWGVEEKIVDGEEPHLTDEREFSWETKFHNNRGDYVLLVEEFERLPIDNGADGPSADPESYLRLVYSCMFKL